MRIPALGVATSALLLALPGSARADEEFAWSPLPVARFAAGPSIFLDPTTVYFAADITAGVHFVPEPIKEDTFGLVWGGDLGFTHEARGFNAFSTAPHVGIGNRWFSMMLQSRLLIGSLNDVTTVGMRNSLVGHFLLDMGTVEVGHQFVGGPSALEHDIRVLAGINPAPLVLLLIQGTETQR